MSEHGRHLQQYFSLFVMYANLGKNFMILFNVLFCIYIASDEIIYCRVEN